MTLFLILIILTIIGIVLVKSINNTEDGPRNVTSVAENYLITMSFSRIGLIEQLKHEGFQEEEATLSVDNCKVDWNKQAIKTAKSYLDSTDLLTDELIQQLEYEGFTNKQARIGAKTNIK